MGYKIVSGIYMIRNLINGKLYIGSSKRVFHRFKRHRGDLRKNCHENNHLQSAWNKYGSSAFGYAIIEECSETLFRERETYWIEFYDSIDRKKGYNIIKPTDPGESYRNKKRKSTKKRILKPIVCINLTLDKKVEMTSVDIRNYLNIPEKKLYKVLSYWRRGIGKRSYRGWVFIYKELYMDGFDYHNYKKPKQT